VIGDLSPREIHSHDSVRQSKALVDWHSMSHSFPRVEHQARGAARGVEAQDGLRGKEHGGGVEGLEEDLRCLLTVGVRVQGCFCQQYLRRASSGMGSRVGTHRVFLAWDIEVLPRVDVRPEALHVAPISDDTTLHWIGQRESATVLLSFHSNKAGSTGGKVQEKER
jgi:hypothetical protein